MLIESVQTVAGWLTNPTTGVNAIRLTVPRYSGDAAPPAVTVVQQFRSDEAARGQAPLTGLPALEVALFQDPASEMAPSVRPFPMDGEVQIQIRYIAAKQTATQVAVRDAALTLRCVARAIAARAIAGTVVNEVQLITASGFRVLAMYVADGDTVVSGALIATLRVRDAWTHPT